MKITARDKKFLTVGSVVAAIIIFVYFLLPFYDNLVEKKKDIEMKERTLEKYLKFIKKQGEFQKNLVKLTREQSNTQGRLLKGETTSLAAADIQKIVDKVSEKSEVQIKSVKVMEADEKEDFVAIPVQVRFESDLSRMNNFVSSIETHRKLLTIPELKIRLKNKRKAGMISVTLQILGFMKKEGTSS